MKTKPNSFISLQINKMSLKSKLIGIAALVTVAGACKKEPIVEPVDNKSLEIINAIKTFVTNEPMAVAVNGESLFIALGQINTGIQEITGDNSVVLDSVRIDGIAIPITEISGDALTQSKLSEYGVTVEYGDKVGLSTNKTTGIEEDAEVTVSR